MRNKSREWFDLAYQFSRGIIPFGTFTQILREDEIQSLFKALRLGSSNRDRKFAKHLRKANRIYVEKRPSLDEFKEERNRVLTLAKRDLQREFPFVETAIYFGSAVGDIDLAFIKRDGLSKSEMERLRLPSRELETKYPIFDWNTPYFFASSSSRKFIEKVVGSHLKFNGRRALEGENREYILSVLRGARLYWGDKSQMEIFRRVV